MVDNKQKNNIKMGNNKDAYEVKNQPFDLAVDVNDSEQSIATNERNEEDEDED